MLTMSYFSLLVNYYLYYYINHSRFWPILSRDLLRNKILQKRINNEKVTLLFTGVQIIKSNSIKLDFWSTPKGRFSMRWYIGACVETYCGRHESLHIIKAHTDSARFDKKIICGNLCEFVADYLERGFPRISTNIFFLLNPCDYFCWILLNLCEGFVRWGGCDGGGAIALF